MNTGDISNSLPQAQTINECLRALPETQPAHSNGKPAVSPSTTNISVRFAPVSLLHLQIRTAYENSLAPE